MEHAKICEGGESRFRILTGLLLASAVALGVPAAIVFTWPNVEPTKRVSYLIAGIPFEAVFAYLLWKLIQRARFGNSMTVYKDRVVVIDGGAARTIPAEAIAGISVVLQGMHSIPKVRLHDGELVNFPLVRNRTELARAIWSIKTPSDENTECPV